jgi:hypothetical protein
VHYHVKIILFMVSGGILSLYIICSWYMCPDDHPTLSLCFLPVVFMPFFSLVFWIVKESWGTVPPNHHLLLPLDHLYIYASQDLRALAHSFYYFLVTFPDLPCATIMHVFSHCATYHFFSPSHSNNTLSPSIRLSRICMPY